MKRAAISAFIIFNMLAIACGSSLPVNQQGPLSRFFTPYLVWTRLLQGWKLFTPTPRIYSKNYRAEIVFRDGKKTIWKRPYPPNWDFFARHLSYQFQKWDLASDYLDTPPIAPLLWRDLGKYLAAQYANPANPPESITFIRSKSQVPLPHDSGYAMPEPSEFQWSDQILYTYHVQDGSLQ